MWKEAAADMSKMHRYRNLCLPAHATAVFKQLNHIVHWHIICNVLHISIFRHMLRHIAVDCTAWFWWFLLMSSFSKTTHLRLPSPVICCLYQRRSSPSIGLSELVATSWTCLNRCTTVYPQNARWISRIPSLSGGHHHHRQTKSLRYSFSQHIVGLVVVLEIWLLNRNSTPLFNASQVLLKHSSKAHLTQMFPKSDFKVEKIPVDSSGIS